MPVDAQNPLSHLTLGQVTEYTTQYQPSLLQAVPRALNRVPIGIDDKALPFRGEDIWTGYEISWLNPQGLPQIAIGVFSVPVVSPNLIESKSFKLYLNSFNQTRFNSWSQVQQLMATDLSATAGAAVTVTLYKLNDFAAQFPVQALAGETIDDQALQINSYEYDATLLSTLSATMVSESLTSDLLKSNCLITNQPDWGSVQITYQGPQIDRASLLRYLISFRSHNEFHEQCVERIFQDLRQMCECEVLTVSARYTRRGGLDINPIRSNADTFSIGSRTVRQ